MYHVYIINSQKKSWYYVGFSKNLNDRLISHNKGHNKSTKPYKPFNLIFVQLTRSRIEARNLEKFLKIRFNKEALIELIDK